MNNKTISLVKVHDDYMSSPAYGRALFQSMQKEVLGVVADENNDFKVTKDEFAGEDFERLAFRDGNPTSISPVDLFSEMIETKYPSLAKFFQPIGCRCGLDESHITVGMDYINTIDDLIPIGAVGYMTDEHIAFGFIKALVAGQIDPAELPPTADPVEPVTYSIPPMAEGETLINLVRVWPEEDFYSNEDPEGALKSAGLSSIRDDFLHELELMSFGRCLAHGSDPALPLHHRDISRIAQPATFPETVREFSEAALFDGDRSSISYSDLFFKALQTEYAGLGLENYISPIPNNWWGRGGYNYAPRIHIRVKDAFIEKAASLLPRQDLGELKKTIADDYKNLNDRCAKETAEWKISCENSRLGQESLLYVGTAFLVAKAVINGDIGREDLKRIIAELD